MSFSRAKIRRFNEIQTHSPPVGTYDPKVEGTIPYPKGTAVHSMGRDSWTGSTQSLWSMNSDRLSSRSSCASVASERIATRLQSAESFGVASASRQRVWTGKEGGKDGGRIGWWRGVTGQASSKAVSEASVKGSVKAKGGDRGGVVRGKPKDEANDEDSCEVKAKAIILVSPETGGKSVIEVTGEALIEATDKAKSEDCRQATGKVDSIAIVKAICQAAGETTTQSKGISKHAPFLPRAMEYEIDQPERLPKESTQEWQHEKLPMFINNPTLRSETRKSELNLPKSDRKRLTEGNGSPRNKQVPDSNSEQRERVLKRFPTMSSGLLVDVVEHISKAEEEAQALRIRIDELELENAELQQAKISTERDLMDEISWRKEEQEKTEALVEKIRGAKRRCKAELKKCQALVEDLRMDYHRRTEELERTFLLVKNLRLEHSRKTEKLEKSQLMAENLESENLKISDALEKSRSLVANLSTETRVKTEQLKSARIAVRNLKFESSVKSTALENSRLTVDNLQLENLRCKEALRHYESYIDSLLVKIRNSSFTQWSRNSPENAFDPQNQTQNLQVKLRRSATDEDCEMTEEPQVHSNLNDRTFLLSDISGSRDSESEIQKTTNVAQPDFHIAENRPLLTKLSYVLKSPSRVQESPSKAPEHSSKDRESCNETQSSKLRSSLSLGEVEPRIKNRQNLRGVKSEPILTDDLSAVCNRIQFLSLDDNGISSETEDKKFKSQGDILGNLLYRDSENLKEYKDNLGYMQLTSLGELHGTLICREPESLEEIQKTLESMESQTPQDCGLWLNEEVLRETREDPEKKNSGELRQRLILEFDQSRIEERNNQSSSTHNQQNNHIAQLENNEGLLDEDTKDLDDNHGSSLSTGNAILGKAAGDGKTTRNCSEEADCKTTGIRLQICEGNDRRRREINEKKDAEMKGSSNEDGGLYKLIEVYEEHLEKFRGKCPPKTNEPRRLLREKFREKFLGPSKEEHGEKSEKKFGERFTKNGEKFGENGEGEFEKKLGEKNVEEKQSEKLGDKSRKKFGDKLKEGSGENPKDKFGGESGAKLTADSTLDDSNSASQWKKRYEELWTVAQPFKDLLSAFHLQQQLLEGHRNAGKAEIEKLSHDFAKVLNHEHDRQMINQIMRLREQNATLKKELELLWVRKATTEVTRR